MITAIGLGLLYVAFFLWSIVTERSSFVTKLALVSCILAGMGCLAAAGILLSLRYMP